MVFKIKLLEKFSASGSRRLADVRRLTPGEQLRKK